MSVTYHDDRQMIKDEMMADSAQPDMKRGGEVAAISIVSDGSRPRHAIITESATDLTEDSDIPPVVSDDPYGPPDLLTKLSNPPSLSPALKLLMKRAGRTLPRPRSAVSDTVITRSLVFPIRTRLRPSLSDRFADSPCPVVHITKPEPETAAASMDAEPSRDSDRKEPLVTFSVAQSKQPKQPQPSVESLRRHSGPAEGAVADAANARLARYRDHLLAWSTVYLGNTRTADAFVRAVARHGASHDPGSDPARLIVRARVRPRLTAHDGGRMPFVLQREFDLVALRATIPDPPSQSHATSRSLHTRRRSSGSRNYKSPSSAGPSTSPSLKYDHHKRLSRPNEIPVHMEYCRAYLPVLAALLLSDHVQRGDSIDLPLPCPESWPHTVAYVYTGRGLTERVRRNVINLAGKP